LKIIRRIAQFFPAKNEWITVISGVQKRKRRRSFTIILIITTTTTTIILIIIKPPHTLSDKPNQNKTKEIKFYPFLVTIIPPQTTTTTTTKQTKSIGC